MGKVIEILRKIRDMKHVQLIERFKHVVRAQAIREYIGVREDLNLTLEVNLIGEEIIHRMSMGRSYVIINQEEGNKQMTKDEIINKLILVTCKEVDYWLLEENKSTREVEYGSIVYKKMVDHYTNLRNKFLEVILSLPEIEKNNDIKP